MLLPLLIPIAHEPGYRTSHIGRHRDGQFLADALDLLSEQLPQVTVMLHLFDHEGRHLGSEFRSGIAYADADEVLAQVLGSLADVVYGDIAIRLFEVRHGGVLFGLVDKSGPGRGGASAELYPQGLGFFPPFDGLYDT